LKEGAGSGRRGREKLDLPTTNDKLECRG